MKKYIRFSDIPKAIEAGQYQCTYRLAYFVEYIEELIETEGLQMNPDFQRGHVWTEEQQISYMEALLSKRARNALTLYFNYPFWTTSRNKDPNVYSDFVCVDGLQRYTAISRFVHNEIKVFGSYFREYEDKPSSVDHVVLFNVNCLKSKAEVLQWYVEMNAGGTPHAEEEIERVRKMMSQSND